MLFSSMIFLSIFLPSVVLIYFIVKKNLRNHFLLISSLLFYAYGEPRYLAIMLLIIILNYIFGILVSTEKYKKLFLLISVIVNLSFLVYFKYLNFFIKNINNYFPVIISSLDVVMPIGISFFTFQSLSYVIDVYRKEVEVCKDIYKLALYVSFFPQLIAGPIVKYHDIQKEIDTRNESFQNIYEGLKRFSFGLGKKIIIANTVGQVANNIFSLEITIIDYKIAWMGILCYSLQIYFDFSGYSDMAIGLGKVFGFHFLENFNYPYISKSITEFWRRWHISLSTWLKEYLYISLGGNQKGNIRTYINLSIVFLATGIWHGAKWSFLFWGVWHGIFIVLEKIIKIEHNPSILKRILGHIYTILIFVIGWVFFRSENLNYAFEYIKVMFGLKVNKVIGFSVMYYLDNKVIAIFFIAILISTGIFRNFLYSDTKLKLLVFNSLSLLIVAISMILIAVSTYNPFIYFRF